MALLHLSINADDPERIARFLAGLLGGEAMPFPPFPDSWIAFTQEDDGTAIEVYPITHQLTAGSHQVACETGESWDGPTFVHAALGSPLSGDTIIARAENEDWLARRCNRGPFDCIEIWLENRLLIEVLDPAMQQQYRAGMTQQNWRDMFHLGAR